MQHYDRAYDIFKFIRFLLEIDFYWKYMGYIWDTFGIHLVYIWDTFGIHLGYIGSIFTGNRYLLEIHGIHMGYIWDTFGIHIYFQPFLLEILLDIYWKYMGYK